MSEIGRLATEIVQDEFSYLTGTEQSVAISSASGWLLNNLGQLNNLIFTAYSGENPGMMLEESSIYRNIYLYSYYKNKAGSVLRNMDSSTLQWLTLKEGDSQITLQNKNEVAKSYLAISKQNREDIDKLVWTYNQYQAYPRSVDIIYEEVATGALANPIIFEVEPYTINGFIDIPVGQNYVTISEVLPASLEKLSISLVKPATDSPNLSYSVVGTSISQTGFVVGLGATVSQTGYRINYGVK